MSDPRQRLQPITSCASLFIACLLLCGIASAEPSITLSKRSGPPTSRIGVSGRGFEPNVGVDIFFDTKDEALIVTDGSGEFHNARIHAPRSARPGEHWVTALERNNDKGAQQPFLVQTNWCQFHFDADGTRLNPYENVLNSRTAKSLDLEWSWNADGLELISSPAVVNGILYVGSLDGNLYALNAQTGTAVWNYRTGNAVLSSPAVVNDVVYVGSFDDNVYALNAHTGAKLWSYRTGYFVAAPPTVVDGVVYVGSADGNFYALNAKTGDKLWSYTTGFVNSAAAVANGVVYIGSFDSAGNLYALDAKTGDTLWSYPAGGVSRSSPAVANGVVYIGSYDSNVYALNASTGILLWSYATRDRVQSSPAVADGVIYVSSDDGTLYALNGRTGVKLWSHLYQGGGPTSPVVANGLVYSATFGGEVFVLNTRTGRDLWNYNFGETVWSSPAVVNGVLYVGKSYPSVLYAFRPKPGSEGEQEPSKRPELNVLHPNLNLKVSKPGTTASSAELSGLRENCR
ncbi:MAG TPA: PQQ-binding-like beta-propeller repeat protein [Terriglobales bacterium]|nr:PQQ-binding-like beta-propeller repeat protein [Terriglobales bacterium]